MRQYLLSGPWNGKEARFWNKSTEEAFWITAEAENEWSNCGEAAATAYRVYYDNLVVRR
jgi:hypothetical protein